MSDSKQQQERVQELRELFQDIRDLTNHWNDTSYQSANYETMHGHINLNNRLKKVEQLIAQHTDSLLGEVTAAIPEETKHNTYCPGNLSTDACQCGANSYNYALRECRKALALVAVSFKAGGGQ